MDAATHRRPNQPLDINVTPRLEAANAGGGLVVGGCRAKLPMLPILIASAGSGQLGGVQLQLQDYARAIDDDGPAIQSPVAGVS